jgi:hypothetical protein
MRRFLTALAIGILDILSKMGPSTMSCLVVIPSHAKILSAEGWTKKKVKGVHRTARNADPDPDFW